VTCRLSVVMIAKDAADLLPDCLASVSFADEIILLDSGSRDATLEIAQAAGVKVFVNTVWQGYGLQRQLAQRHASGDYILMIDTDERVTPELAAFSISRGDADRDPFSACSQTPLPHPANYSNNNDTNRVGTSTVCIRKKCTPCLFAL